MPTAKPTSTTTQRHRRRVAGGFILTLIVVSFITVRNLGHDHGFAHRRARRTLGFLFGLGAGMLLMVVAFLFFAWLVTDNSSRNGCATPSRG